MHYSLRVTMRQNFNSSLLSRNIQLETFFAIFLDHCTRKVVAIHFTPLMT